MADKWSSLNTFWNSFDVPAYDANTVPDNAVMPYITYEAAVGDFYDAIPLNASLWYFSNSWAEISAKAEEIGGYIDGGVGVAYNGGRIWITKGTPFAQRMSEPGSSMTRRVLININAEFH